MTNKEFSEYIKELVEMKIAELEPGKSYLVKQLIDQDVWEQLYNGDRRMAGRIVSALVESQSLPLVYVGKTSANACQYRLK